MCTAKANSVKYSTCVLKGADKYNRKALRGVLEKKANLNSDYTHQGTLS